MRSAMVGLAALLAGGVLLFCVGCPGDETPAPKEDSGAGAPGDEVPAADAQKLVGLWKGKVTPEVTTNMEGGKGEWEGPDEIEASVEFKEDGTMTMDMMGFELSATWELVKAEGNKLTLNAVLDTGPSEGEGKIEVEPEDKEQELTIVFETDDRITFTFTEDPDEPLTLERQR